MFFLVFFPLGRLDSLFCLKGMDRFVVPSDFTEMPFLLLACGFVSSILSKGFTGEGHNMNLSLSVFQLEDLSSYASYFFLF